MKRKFGSSLSDIVAIICVNGSWWATLSLPGCHNGALSCFFTYVLCMNLLFSALEPVFIPRIILEVEKLGYWKYPARMKYESGRMLHKDFRTPQNTFRIQLGYEILIWWLIELS